MVPDVAALDITLHVDLDCSYNDKWSMKLAADSWKKQTNGLVNIKLVHDLDFLNVEGLNEHYLSGHHVLVCLPADSYQVVRHEAEEGKRVYAWVFPGGGVRDKAERPVTINAIPERMNISVREAVYLHEFGHLVGCDHLPDSSSVMYPIISVGSPECLKRADLAEFCRVNDCGNVKMYPCE